MILIHLILISRQLVSTIPSVNSVYQKIKMSVVGDCVKRFEDTNLNRCNFSIDHILNVAGEKQPEENFQTDFEDKRFEWLNCTRYRPPKLPRNKRKEGIQRRKLGRNPRIPFSSSQVAFLEAKFLQTPYLSSSDVIQLANYLQLSETRVKIWFQNRRARERRDRENKCKVNEKPQKDSPNERISVDLRDDSPSESERSYQNLPIHYFQSLRYFIPSEQSFVPLSLPLDLSERNIPCK